MKRRLAIVLALLLCTVMAWAQEPQPQEPEQQPAPAEPPIPPREVGKAQTQEELDAWNAISQSTAQTEKVGLCQQFLETYPESGLTPYVYYTLASVYRQAQDVENFMTYGEKALEELPQLPDILAYLAFFYSEKGQNLKAQEYAERALEAVGAVERPAEVTAEKWAEQNLELNAEAHYALGKVGLNRSQRAQGDRQVELLAGAAQNFEQTLEQAPRHSYAAFRLGETYSRQQEYDKAIDAYARAVVIGDVISQYAQAKLKEVYEFVHKGTDGMNKVLEEEKADLAEAEAERQRMIQEMAAAETEEEAMPETPPIPAIPVKPPLM